MNVINFNGGFGAFNTYRPEMLPKVRSDLIMSSAQGMPCTIRIASFVPGRRCWGQDTTVSCHLPVWGKGVSTKCTDMACAYGCGACHAIIDGPDKEAREYLFKKYGAAMFERMLNGLTETHALMLQAGVINVPDATFTK